MMAPVARSVRAIGTSSGGDTLGACPTGATTNVYEKAPLAGRRRRCFKYMGRSSPLFSVGMLACALRDWDL
jgi:hypothetical protein